VATAERGDEVVDLTVRLVVDEVDRAAAYGVRHEVFVGEQGVPLDIERDDLDETAEHAVAFDADGSCIGAGRLVLGADGTAVVGRMAVRAAARGTGVGAALLACLEQRARELGAGRVELHAQTHARGFYERAGYETFGDEYEEAGLPHIDMRRDIR
jgi:predicted GNAT family N-acyltransferase